MERQNRSGGRKEEVLHRIVREKTKETIKKGKEAKEESERRIKRCKAKA